MIPIPICRTRKQALKRKQYVDGETKYNEELDCVSIIKSIRELKLLTKVVLNQCQRQTLAFDKANVIPIDKDLKTSDEKMLMNYIPSELANEEKAAEYTSKLDDFLSEYSDKDMNHVDYNI